MRGWVSETWGGGGWDMGWVDGSDIHQGQLSTRYLFSLMVPRSHHKSTTQWRCLSAILNIVSLITAPQQFPSLYTSLYTFHRTRNWPLIKIDLAKYYCFICGKRKCTSVANQIDFISCASKPAFLTSSSHMYI